jgi:hypothetical protein
VEHDLVEGPPGEPEALCTEITSGHLAIGDRLPTEHELSHTHGLARGTVREALAKLEDLGMIDRTPKRGTVVVASRPVGPDQPVATSPSDIVSLAATTRPVEPRTAEITLTRATARRVGARAGSRWFLIEATFARRFNDLVGGPPMSYLGCWRLCLAADLLRETDASTDAIARQVGYADADALAVAFKRTYGLRPTSYRRLAL